MMEYRAFCCYCTILWNFFPLPIATASVTRTVVCKLLLLGTHIVLDDDDERVVLMSALYSSTDEAH